MMMLLGFFLLPLLFHDVVVVAGWITKASAVGTPEVKVAMAISSKHRRKAVVAEEEELGDDSFLRDFMVLKEEFIERTITRRRTTRLDCETKSWNLELRRLIMRAD
jgi:hypothetical protein